MTTYTYILKSSKDGSFYVGISQDVENRIKAHNAGRVGSTSHKIPWELAYTKKHSLALLDANIAYLQKFNPVLRARFIEIKTHLGYMNEVIDDARYYFRLSFQKDISNENYKIADTNMVDSYKVYAEQARLVIDVIGKILFDE